jgi:hypothetical protein
MNSGPGALADDSTGWWEPERPDGGAVVEVLEFRQAAQDAQGRTPICRIGFLIGRVWRRASQLTLRAASARRVVDEGA